METYLLFDRSIYFGKTASKCAFVTLFRCGYFWYNFFCVSAHFSQFFCDFWLRHSKSGNTKALTPPIFNERVHQKRSIQIFEHLPKRNLLWSRFFLLLNYQKFLLNVAMPYHIAPL